MVELMIVPGGERKFQQVSFSNDTIRYVFSLMIPVLACLLRNFQAIIQLDESNDIALESHLLAVD